MGKSRSLLVLLGLLLVVGTLPGEVTRQRAVALQGATGVEQFRSTWRVLEPITRRDLSIFPVVSEAKVDTSGFITLDEGLAAGTVKVAERGQLESPLYRRRDPRLLAERPEPWPLPGGASVNELVLVNESSRPLILLAGEVVSGGKQNRIIGADLVVPPKSDPVPLTVFCVEHGRWSAGGGAFGAASAMAKPEMRKEAQVNRSQAGVWRSVEGVVGGVPGGSPTQNYLDALNSPPAKRELEKVATAIEADYERELRGQLPGHGAVGVVIAINGELVWSDVFPSPELFRKYWPKLLRSYVMEAKGYWRDTQRIPSVKEAQAFLLESRGHVTIKMEPEAYRRTEISAEDYQVVALEAVGKSEDLRLLLHYNKMARG